MKSEEESEKELIKCLLPKNTNLPPQMITEREIYISILLKDLKEIQIKKNEEQEKKKDNQKKRIKIMNGYQNLKLMMKVFHYWQIVN